jgi:hypothetical protein
MSTRPACTSEMKAPWSGPGLRELLALAALVAFGCGLAVAQGDLLFATIFTGESATVIAEALQRFQCEIVRGCRGSRARSCRSSRFWQALRGN